MRRFRLSAPASSANLGSGFDAVALALECRMSAEVEVLDAGTPPPAVAFAGAHAPSNGGLAAAFAAALARGAGSSALPPLRVHIENAIPLGAGLGSSAAVRTLGVAIGALARGAALDRAAVAREVAALERHADNALAAAYGGAVVGVDVATGAYTRFEVAGGLHATVFHVRAALSTHEARTLLPDGYARADAVFAAGHAALLGAALAAGRWTLLREAMRDRLHQPYRARAFPWLEPALAAALAAERVYGAALSGAGPSVIVFAPAAADVPETAIAGAIEAAGGTLGALLRLAPALDGLHVERVAS